MIMIHEDAIYTKADIDWMNRVYSMDIREGEVLEFIEECAAPVYSGVLINEKRYIRIVPKSDAEGQPP